jgi:hypothetical protein
MVSRNGTVSWELNATNQAEDAQVPMASTSAAAEPSSEILQEIKAFFSWNPPRLIPASLPPGKKTLTSTRPPAFYDKHIPVDTALWEVKHLPSLIQQLAENVDTALHTASETLPSLKGFITAEDCERDIENLSQIVADEKGVASYYDKTTTRFCTPLASTLALHPQALSSQWHSLVVWTTSVPRSGHAIMDGLLHFLPMPEDGSEKSKSKWANIMERMESEKCRTFVEMSRATTALGSWEIKSTSAGPQEVMRAVPTLGKFSWTFCNSEACLATQKHAKELEKGKNTPVGRDARNPPWNLGVCSFSQNRENVIYYTIGRFFKAFS